MKYYLSIILSVLLLSSCSVMEYYDDSCGPADSENEFINLTFRLMAPMTSASRFDEFHEEVASDYPKIEDKIFENDISFYVFAGIGKNASPDRQRFIAKIEGATLDPHTSVLDRICKVDVKISRKEFEEIIPEETENVLFRVVAFANTKNTLTDPTKYDTYANLIATASTWQFNVIGSNYYIYSVTGAISSRGRIPMFGTTKFVVTREQLHMSQADAPIWGDDIYLLRSVAKIKVVDNIQNKNSDGYPRIDAVTFIGWPAAYMLPKDAINYANGQQTETPNIVAEQTSTEQINLFNNIAQHYIGYVPEQDMSTPRITFKVKFKDETFKEYEIPLPNNKEIGNHLLRNHIYTLSVDRVARDDVEAEAEARWIVEPWNINEVPLNYSTNVSVVEPNLDPSSYAAKYDNGRIVMKPWSANGSVPVKINFVITSPVGLSWKAFLLSTDGTPNAFAFYQSDSTGEPITDENGQRVIVPSVSGIIDGHTRSYLNIVSVNPAPEVTNYAKLQVVVTLADGSVEEVNVVAPGVFTDTGVKNYTIVQSTLN